MKVPSLMMVGQAANMTSLMGMTLMTEPTLVLRARRMTVTTLPPYHSQVSTVNLCACMFMCVNSHVMWVGVMCVLL